MKNKIFVKYDVWVFNFVCLLLFFVCCKIGFVMCSMNKNEKNLLEWFYYN